MPSCGGPRPLPWRFAALRSRLSASQSALNRARQRADRRWYANFRNLAPRTHPGCQALVPDTLCFGPQYCFLAAKPAYEREARLRAGLTFGPWLAVLRMEVRRAVPAVTIFAASGTSSAAPKKSSVKRSTGQSGGRFISSKNQVLVPGIRR